jgi:hypothetical protein
MVVAQTEVFVSSFLNSRISSHRRGLTAAEAAPFPKMWPNSRRSSSLPADVA